MYNMNGNWARGCLFLLVYLWSNSTILATNPVIQAFMKLTQQCWWLHKGSLLMQLDAIDTMMCSKVVHLR